MAACVWRWTKTGRAILSLASRDMGIILFSKAGGLPFPRAVIWLPVLWLSSHPLSIPPLCILHLYFFPISILAFFHLHYLSFYYLSFYRKIHEFLPGETKFITIFSYLISSIPLIFSWLLFFLCFFSAVDLWASRFNWLMEYIPVILGIISSRDIFLGLLIGITEEHGLFL